MGSTRFLRGLGILAVISAIIGGMYFIATARVSTGIFLMLGDFVLGALLIVIADIGENVDRIRRKLLNEKEEEEPEKERDKETEADYCCPECGCDIRRDQRYCPKCGAEIDWS
jgi:hypothetical protein